MASLEVLGELVVATDDHEVLDVVEAFGGRAVATRADHSSGTDRVAEVVERPEFSTYRWIINVQGDEPFLPLDAVAAAVALVRAGWEVGTVAAPITETAEWRDASRVKVVRGDDGRALYFSRAAIPHDHDGGSAQETEPLLLQHLGLYAFERDSLRRATALPPHPLELREGLEQLRWLAAGFRIGVAVIEDRGVPGIDTQEDLARAEGLLAGRKTSI